MPWLNYSKAQLYSLRKHWSLSFESALALKSHGVFKRCGTRGGHRGHLEAKESFPVKPSIIKSSISRVTLLTKLRDGNVLRRIAYKKRYMLLVVLSTNIRSITNKVEELQQVAVLNHADALCMTES